MYSCPPFRNPARKRSRAYMFQKAPPAIQAEGLLRLLLRSRQHQPAGPDLHPDLGLNRKPGLLQPPAAHLNPRHRDRAVGCTILAYSCSACNIVANSPEQRLANNVQNLLSAKGSNTVLVNRHSDGTIINGRNQGDMQND